MHPFHGGEIVADDAHVFWSEAADREYDDRSIAIARAAVYRRPHGDGPVETIFHFERDDAHCLPHTLRVEDGRAAWYCCQPVFDSNARADPSRHMLVRDGALHSVLTPYAHEDQVAADGREVVVRVNRYAEGVRLVRVDALTGRTDEGAALPAGYGSYRSRLEGLTAERVVGTLSNTQRALVWTVARSGGEDDRPRVVRRLPDGASIASVAVDARHIYVSWTERYPGRAHLERIEGDTVRELLVAEHGFRALLRRDGFLYFEQAGEIRRLDLASGQAQTLAQNARIWRGPRSIAVGGGFVYWLESRGGYHVEGLFRARLPGAAGAR